MSEAFEVMLTGGHPNSLGRTVEVVTLLLAHPDRFAELFACYNSRDDVVRLRTSSAIKRVEAERPDLVLPWVDRLISEIGELDQASAQWTLAQLFDRMSTHLSADQREGALRIMQRNLAEHGDWIVLNMTMETLSKWAANDPELKEWLKPHLERLSNDPRRSVSKRATSTLARLQGT